MTVTPDFGTFVFLINKGIIGRYLSIEFKPNNATSMVCQILSIVALTAVTDTEKNMPLIIKSDTTAKMSSGTCRGVAYQ